MSNYPPFMNSYGLITKILNKIKEAKTPDRFTQDYLGKTLGFSSGSAKPFIPVAKRLGLLGSDGSPTEIYHQFRNPDHSKGAMAKAVRTGYSDLFSRNENANALDHAGLSGLVVQATGLDKGSVTLRSIVGTFEALKQFSDFAAAGKELPKKKVENDTKEREEEKDSGLSELNLSYSISLVLPKSDDIAVFNAIFKSLREHILKK